MEYLDTILAFAVVMMLLSLVITTLNQVVVAALGLRSKNLLWGVTKLIARSPELRKYSATIAQSALAHPALTAMGKRATWIGSEELLKVLQDLSSDTESPLPDDAKAALGALLTTAPSDEIKRAQEDLAAEFSKLFPAQASKMATTFALVEGKTRKFGSEMTAWFEMIMSRTTDRFVTQTRYSTMFFALVLSLGLQIDTLEIIKTLSTDTELRASLLQNASQTMSRAEAILSRESIAVAALKSIQQDVDDLKSTEVPELVTREQGTAWLDQELADSSEIEQVRERYLEAFDQLAAERLGSLGTQILGLRSDLEESRLVFIPNSWSAYRNRWENFGEHVTGVLLSLLLLSLGAPFWFNALKTLSSLRPLLAGTVDPSNRGGNQSTAAS